MKRKITITIELENAAFDEEPAKEASRILVGIAASLELDGFTGAGTETDTGVAAGIWDHNGNWTGFWRAILADGLEVDPYRWEFLERAELEVLRTAIHNRIYELSKGGRKLTARMNTERKYLEAMQRQLNLETERRQ